MMDHEADRLLFTRVGKLRGHWGWILEWAGACAAVALLVSLFLHKVYRATTYIMVSESKIGSGSGDTPWQQAALLPTFVPFVDNDALISESLNKLQLNRPPYNLTADRFRRRGYLDIQIPKSTRLLELDVEFPNARLAAALANDLARRAVEFNNQMNAADTSATREFLKKQLEEATERLAQAAAARVKIQQNARMEDREKELGILLGERDRLSARLEQLRLDLARDQSKVRTLKEELATQPRTYSLKKSVTADRFLERATEKLAPSAEPLTVTEESLNTTRVDIQQHLVKATVDVAAESAGAKEAEERLRQLGNQIADLLARLTALRNEVENADHEYSLAYEAVKTSSHEYQSASVTVSSKSQDLKQVAPAVVPERPVRPNILLNTLLGFVLGVLLFASLTLLLENLREARRVEEFSVEEQIVRPIIPRN